MLDLQTIYNKYTMSDCGGDKGTAHSYIDIYDRYFQNTRHNINLLEIGVYQGHSLKLWSEYFVDSQIIGIDIDKTLLSFPEENFIVYECDATSQKDINSIIPNIEFDFIIDDGSHNIYDQISSFNILFSKLKNGGIYFIEDINNLNQDYSKLIALHKNVQIFDLRHFKNRSDDVLVVIQKIE